LNMKAIIVLAFVAVAIGASIEVRDQFREFVRTYQKKYDSVEEFERRFQIFQDNLDIIERQNSLSVSAKYGVTKFADLSTSEFASKYLGYHASGEIKNKEPKIDIPEHYKLPASFDWRDKGAVTPVYNQEQCGSCWAFSATEAVESQWFLTKGQLISLSPQQIVDCDTGNGDYGCEGGDTTTAYKYVIGAGGMETWTNYPYTAEDGTCAFSKSKIAASIQDWTYITSNDNETQMQIGLVNSGPLSICVDASSWQFYVEGVVGPLCGDSLDHCVMITGFGNYTDVFGSYQVWNVRNSWGSDWGYDGYLYVERGGNYCGIADEVTIPLVNKP